MFFDNARRKLFVAYFKSKPLSGSREELMRKTGYSKGRVTQLFDEAEPFGELVARRLATKLDLPENAFLPNSDTPWPFEVSYERIANLSERHKGRIESMLMMELEKIEQELSTKITAEAPKTSQPGKQSSGQR